MSLAQANRGNLGEPRVVILGTLDTKGHETAFLRDTMAGQGVATCVIDVGVLSEPVSGVFADVPRARVAQAAGVTLEALQTGGDRGRAVACMAKGAAALVSDLYRQGRVSGVVGLGGGAGASIAAAVMQGLPVGLPKLIVSTMAAGDTRPYIGTKDIMFLYPVVDLAGLNQVSRAVLLNAAAAMVGMVKVDSRVRPAHSEAKPLLAATMFGVTTPCVDRARQYLEALGYEVLVFHATGVGGRTLEGLVRDGLIRGVLDVTTTELADELVGGILSAGPDRLEAMGQVGIPHIVVPGALDMVNFGPPETVPERFRDRLFYRHNAQVTLMRTTAQECAELGRIMAEKLNRARTGAGVLAASGLLGH